MTNAKRSARKSKRGKRLGRQSWSVIITDVSSAEGGKVWMCIMSDSVRSDATTVKRIALSSVEAVMRTCMPTASQLKVTQTRNWR